MELMQWPDQSAQNMIAQSFQLASGFPGIVWMLDATHMRLAAAIGGDSHTLIARVNFKKISKCSCFCEKN